MLSSLSRFRRRLLDWYDGHRRELPWRRAAGSAAQLDPYRILVSELMLQQTQVATVIPYFLRFVEKFPTLESLACAEEQDVLRLWQGLGYYSRARNLQQTARNVMRDHAGSLPEDPEELLKLPGIGRYTAGAVASLAFGRRAPILDGNVARVLCRLDRIESDPRQRTTQLRLWERAAEVLPRKRVGDFNSALMELGATVCTPRSPQCSICPVRQHCEAYAAGVQERIPAPRKTAVTPMFRRHVFCISRASAHRGSDCGPDRDFLIEQRPPRGRWAGMWQFITLEAGDSPPGRALLHSHLSLRTTPLEKLATIAHALTHRRYTFEVFTCIASGRSSGKSKTPDPFEKGSGVFDLAGGRRWVTLEQLAAYPLPRPHVRIAEMLRP